MRNQADQHILKPLSAAKRFPSHLPYELLIVILVLGLRIIPYLDQIFVDSDPIVRDPDAVYHLRRAELIEHNFPQFPIFDAYINHPEGAYIIWPPLYDLFLATSSWILNLLPGIFSPLIGLVFLPPLIMSLTCLVIYRIGIRLFPHRRWLAFAAALVPAFLPATLLYSYIGQLDHHVVEFLLIALFVNKFSASLELFPEETNSKKILRIGWLPGLFLGLGLLVQHGLLILEAVIFLTLILWYPRRGAVVWALGGAINATAFLVTLPFGFLAHLGGVPLAHTHFGLFQPLALLEASLLCATLWIILKSGKGVSSAVSWMKIAAGSVLTLVLGIFLFNDVLTGASYIFRGWSTWQVQIGESQSIWGLPLKNVISQLSMQMSYMVIFLPLGWFIILRRWRNSPSPYIVLLSATLIFTIMGTLQLRYLPYLALFLGLILVILVERAMQPKRRSIVSTVMPLLIIASYYPCLKAVGAKDITFDVFEELHPVLLWLKENTPPASNHLDPRTSGNYGVLAEWSLGHYIQYYGQRPVLADNFGEHASNLSRVSDFFLAKDNDEAYNILDEHHVRYILCRDLFWTLRGVLLGDDIGGYIKNKTLSSDSASQITFSPRLFPTVLYRLIWRYGSFSIDPDGIYYPPLERLRLVAESEGSDDQIVGGTDIALVKLFEYVPGAYLEITGLPAGTKVDLLGYIYTPQGRKFPYLRIIKVDENGHLLLILPYPNVRSDNSSYIDEYKIKHGEETRILPLVTEEMVQSGKTYHLSW